MKYSVDRRRLIGISLVAILTLAITRASFQVSARQQELSHQEKYHLLNQRTVAAQTSQQNTEGLFLLLRILILASLGLAFYGERTSHKKTITILESITDAFISLDPRWRFTYVNHHAELVLQKKRTELLGKSIWEMFPEAEGSVFEQQYHRAMQEHATIRFEEFVPSLRRWFEVTAYPSHEGLSVYFRETTDRKSRKRPSDRHRNAWKPQTGCGPDRGLLCQALAD